MAFPNTSKQRFRQRLQKLVGGGEFAAGTANFGSRCIGVPRLILGGVAMKCACKEQIATRRGQAGQRKETGNVRT